MCLADLYPLREPLPSLVAFPSRYVAEVGENAGNAEMNLGNIQDVMGFRLESHAADPSPRNSRKTGATLLCSAGMWSSTQARWRLQCDEREYCRLARGRVRIMDKYGRRWEFDSGGAFLLLRGFDGELEVLDPVQVIYMVFSMPEGGALDWCMSSEGRTALGRDRLQN